MELILTGFGKPIFRSIPITKYHPTFHFAKNLPILFVDEYSDISYSLLDNYLKNLEKKIITLKY